MFQRGYKQEPAPAKGLVRKFDIMPHKVILSGRAIATTIFQKGKNALVSIVEVAPTAPTPTEDKSSTSCQNALRASPLVSDVWPSRPAFWRRRSASIIAFLEPEGAQLEASPLRTGAPKPDLKFDSKPNASFSVVQAERLVQSSCGVGHHYGPHESIGGEETGRPSPSRSFTEPSKDIRGYALPDRETARRFSRRREISEHARRRAGGMVRPRQAKF